MFLGRGYFNSRSKIRVRVLTRQADEAARATSAFAYDDDAVATRLCDHGVRFVSASAAQAATLRTTGQMIPPPRAVSEGMNGASTRSAAATEYPSVSGERAKR